MERAARPYSASRGRSLHHDANMLQVTTPQSRLPELIAAAGERASMRFLEFFAANIRNPHTRRAYYRAAEEFLAWCASVGVPSIARPADTCCNLDRGVDARTGAALRQATT